MKSQSAHRFLVGGANMRSIVVVLKTLFMAACAVVLFGFLGSKLSALDSMIPLNLPPWVTYFGIALIVIGTILSFICFAMFARGGALTPGPTFPDPNVFISRGPYNYVRNPMAKGGLAVLLGWGLYERSPAILLLGLLTAVLMHLLVVCVEEPKLERRFGQSYLAYKGRVNRWVPSWRTSLH
jgi:protein-S-isoprenylcysteine O-methyltransferase Ste14